jgi:hypothetical protein
MDVRFTERAATHDPSPRAAATTTAASPASTDRRRRRSDDTITALHYQLAYTRAEARMEACVLVDDAGCLVAGAGAWPVCEELAAFAPLLADRRRVSSVIVGGRLAAMEADVVVQPVSIDGAEVLLCSKGGGARPEQLARAADGCRRILAPGS